MAATLQYRMEQPPAQMFSPCFFTTTIAGKRAEIKGMTHLAALLFLLLPSALLCKELSGLWQYGIDRNPEYAVQITQSGQRIRADYLIRDPQSGARFIYARARGVQKSFWDCYLEGKYIQSCGRTRKGTRFRTVWLIFDNGNKIQTLSYRGVYKIKNYLVRRGSPYGSEE